MEGGSECRGAVSAGGRQWWEEEAMLCHGQGVGVGEIRASQGAGLPAGAAYGVSLPAGASQAWFIAILLHCYPGLLMVGQL